MATVVNQSGSTVVEGVLHADKDYRFDGLKSGERRRFTFHPRDGDSYRVVGRLASGRTFESPGPYSSGGYGSRSTDGPDQENVIVIEPISLLSTGPDEALTARHADALGAAGYQPDQRLANPSRNLEAFTRVGPSLKADQAWRVMLVEPGGIASSGPVVFEATGVEGLHLEWLSDHRLKIETDKAHVLRARSVVGGFRKSMSVDVNVAHHR
ncbi:MAG TPA: hypothetical protein VL358_01120 [Caulobacteraceae bacterium]|nr:hypothetical protein [Caulobacteraceae bacterium]